MIAQFIERSEKNRQQDILILCGGLSVILYGYLALQSTAYAEATLWDLWIVCSLCAFISVCCWYYYCRSRAIPSIPLIIGFAVVFRLIGIAIFPILEDDFYRYLWDGRMLVEYGTPYGIAPSQFFSSENIDPTFDEILGNINYPDVATIYGPVCQWLFALAYVIAPGELWPIKILLVMADVAIILMLASLVRPAIIKVHYLILYAWCPLIIKEFAITAHPDILGVMFMVAALLLAQRQHFYWASTALALAVSSKIFAIIIVPLLLGFYWRRWLLFLLVAVLVAWPLGLVSAWLPGGLVAMADAWLFNAPLYILLQAYFPFIGLKIVLLVSFCLIWLLFFFRKSLVEKPISIRGDYVFGLFFLCIPVLNPWYLIWLLPFAVIYPSCWAWIASVSVLLSYAAGINLGNSELDLYQQPYYIVAVEFGLILAGLLVDYFFRYSRERVNNSR